MSHVNAYASARVLLPPQLQERAKGRVTFRFTNKGSIKHDFKIAGKKSRLIRKGKSTSITVSLKKGTYKYVCTVQGHAAAGMKGKFRVR